MYWSQICSLVIVTGATDTVLATLDTNSTPSNISSCGPPLILVAIISANIATHCCFPNLPGCLDFFISLLKIFHACLPVDNSGVIVHNPQVQYFKTLFLTCTHIHSSTNSMFPPGLINLYYSTSAWTGTYTNALILRDHANFFIILFIAH